MKPVLFEAEADGYAKLSLYRGGYWDFLRCMLQYVYRPARNLTNGLNNVEFWEESEMETYMGPEVSGILWWY